MGIERTRNGKHVISTTHIKATNDAEKRLSKGRRA